METLGQSFILLCLIGVVSAVSHPSVAGDSFCYDDGDPSKCGPQFWDGMCSSGKEQSPVDLNFNLIETVFSLRKTTFSLSNEYFQPVNTFYVKNTGESLMVQLNPEVPTSNLRLQGAELRSSYTFSQLHFHWGERNSVGSEHTILGKRFPMEVHLVHYKSIYGSFSNAMKQNDREAIAVLAVFFEISKIPNTRINSVFEAVAIPQLRTPGEFMSFNLPLTISSFFPWNLEFVRYLGSLTTPTCDEKVVWTVFKHALPISDSQMSIFRRLRDLKSGPYHNFRPTQPINGRPMSYFKAKGLSSALPSIDRIWSVKEGFYGLLSHTKHLLGDLILRTIFITPTLILSSISNILLRLLQFMIPVIIVYK